MGTATRKAQVRNDRRVALDALIVRKAPEGASESQKAIIASERIAARGARKALANSWGKREGQPGSFYKREASKGVASGKVLGQYTPTTIHSFIR